MATATLESMIKDILAQAQDYFRETQDPRVEAELERLDREQPGWVDRI